MARRLSFLPLCALLLLLLLLFNSMTSAYVLKDSRWSLARQASGDGGLTAESRVCDGRVGDCMDEDEEMAVESESARRSLAAAKKYISYDALKKNRVPCNRRGQSYYNCQRQRQANPYRRGCSVITRCARDLR